MIYEVNQSPESPMEDPLIPEVNPLVAIHSSVEKETNIMTLEELTLLGESYSFPQGVQIRIPEEETITSTCQGEVAFYEAAFHAGLRFPIHPTIRLIYNFTTYALLSSSSTRGEALFVQWCCGEYINKTCPFLCLGTYLVLTLTLNRIKAGYTLG